MKMVSAAKLRKASDRTLQFVPYKDKLGEVLARYLGSMDSEELHLPLATPREIKKVALVAISSNSGLCGTYNSNIQRLVNAAYERHQKAGHEIILITIGKKISEYARRSGKNAIRDYMMLAEKPDYASASDFALKLSEMFLSGEVDSVEILYNHFRNAGVQVPTIEQYLPLSIIKDEGKKENTLYFVEPDPETLINDLVPIVVRMKMYATLLDASTAEHGARTTAMQIASDNAEKMISSITQQYNRARQGVITSELIDIVSGSEAQK